MNGERTVIRVCCVDTCPVPLLLGAPWLHQAEARISYRGRIVVTRYGRFPWVKANVEDLTSMVVMIGAIISPLAIKEFGEGLTHEEELTVRDAVKATTLSEGAILRVVQLLKEFKDVWT